MTATMTETKPQKSGTAPEVRPTLVIGDVHGHLDRLEALLKQEGLLDRCIWCNGTGTVDTAVMALDYDCPMCEGDGWRRSDEGANEVVLLGDVGHFGRDGSPLADAMTWRAAILWADTILWGNHDRGCVSDRHIFGGYVRPRPDQYDLFERARREGKLKLAHSAHGYLLTHAGLHGSFSKQDDIPEIVKTDAAACADWLNEAESEDADCWPQTEIRDAISRARGGFNHAGGILWRDISEKLYDGFPQVFGHSADHAEHEVRYVSSKFHTRKRKDYDIWDQANGGNGTPSYCVDVGGKNTFSGSPDHCLAGVWLPEGRVVKVNL